MTRKNWNPNAIEWCFAWTIVSILLAVNVLVWAGVFATLRWAFNA